MEVSQDIEYRMVHKIKASSIRVYRPSYTIAFYDYLFYLNSTLCTRSVCVFMKNEKLIDIIIYTDLVRMSISIIIQKDICVKIGRK